MEEITQATARLTCRERSLARKWAGITQKRRSGRINVAQTGQTSQRGRLRLRKSVISTRFARFSDFRSLSRHRESPSGPFSGPLAGLCDLGGGKQWSRPVGRYQGRKSQTESFVMFGVPQQLEFPGHFGGRIVAICSFFEQIGPFQALGTPKPVAASRHRSVHRRDLTSAGAISGYLSLLDHAAMPDVRRYQ